MNARDVFTGMTLYAVGDTVATLITGEFLYMRMLGMMFVGAVVYAYEIPKYFRWLDSKGFDPLVRGLLAAAYFNPLWIARHILFIRLYSSQPISWDILNIGLTSFLYAAPVTILANYVIQSRIPLSARFAASASFSMCMAIYYGLSSVYFA